MEITRDQFYNFVKTKKDKDEFISPATQYYLKYFDQFQKTGKKVSLNWYAIFPVWFFYRKMYLAWLAVGGTYTLIDKVSELNIFPTDGIKDLIRIGLTLFAVMLCIIFGNYMYLNHASIKILKSKYNSGVVSRWGNILLIILLGMNILNFIGILIPTSMIDEFYYD